MRYFLILVLFLSFLACKTNPDTEAPIIQLLSISPSLSTDTICGELEPNNVIYLHSGQNLVLSLKFSDNEGLSQYKIDIHENFDCHGHRGPTVNPWQVLQLTDMSGLTVQENITLTVPNDVTAGNYDFQIKCLDLSGNEAGATEAYSIVIRNSLDTIPPEARIDVPSQSSITKNPGDLLTISGTALDNELLDGGRLELVYFTPSGNRIVAEIFQFNSAHGNTYNYQFNYTLPNTLTSGNYDFEVRIFDAVGNSFFTPELRVQIN
jgi:hypothetical protein